MAQIAVFGANPINALTVRIGLGRGLVGGGFADGIDLFNALAVFFALLLRHLLLAVPAHLFGDLRFRFVGIAVFIQQFHVFVRARVGFLHELLVIVLVPVFVGIFLPALM